MEPSIAAIISCVATLGTAFIVNYFKTKKEIVVATKTHDVSNTTKAFADLEKALKSIKDLEEELSRERVINIKREERMNSIKVILRIVIKQLKAEFEDDHVKQETLNDLKSYIDE